MSVKAIVTIYDKKAEQENFFGLYANKLVALRDFSEVCKDEKGMVKKYPEDYEMHIIGYMDDKSGALRAEKETIGQAIEYVKMGE